MRIECDGDGPKSAIARLGGRCRQNLPMAHVHAVEVADRSHTRTKVRQELSATER